MKKFKLIPVVLALGLSVFSQMATAVLFSDKAVVKNDGSERVTAKVNFPTPVSGDLYVATQVGGRFLFLTNDGYEFTTDVVPLASNNQYEGEYLLFDFSGAGIAPGQYPLYQVVTEPGTDPLDFTNWVGGLAGLQSFNFSIGLSPEITKDFNGDGFADDDLNHDGFHDQPRNDLSGNESEGNENEGNESEGNEGEDNNQPTPTPTPTPTPSTAKGKSLYSVNCSNCHGATPRYNKISRAVNPSRTRLAIRSNAGGMGYLKFLSDAELQLIANYVKNP